MTRKNLIIFYIAIILNLNLLTQIVNASSASDALQQLDRAQNAISYLKALNFTTYRLEDLFNDAKFSYDSLNYARSESISKEVVSLKEKAISLNSEIAS